MATLLQEILTNNYEFLANNKCTKEISKYPQKKFALLTCMDTRLVELINKALGIHRGDAKIIQNAGTSLIGEMGETVKSLLLTIYVFDIKEIFIVGHYDCGVALTSSKDILHNMRSRGVSEQQLKLIEKDFQVWLDPYTDPIASFHPQFISTGCQILISASLSRLLSVVITGSLPTSSGIRPNFTKS